MSSIIKVDVGTPPSSFNECGGSWTMVEVRLHNFANLASRTTRGEYITSPTFSCFGHEFCLKLYPRGETPTEVGGNDGSKHGYVGLRLQQISNGEPIKIQYGFSVRGKSGKSALVLFCQANSNVQYEVSMIWLFIWSLPACTPLVLTTYVTICSFLLRKS